MAAFDEVVRERLLPGTAMQRVKLWTASGRIVDSDDQRLIDEVHPLGEDQLRVLQDRRGATDVSDLSRDENRLERSSAPACWRSTRRSCPRPVSRCSSRPT